MPNNEIERIAEKYFPVNMHLRDRSKMVRQALSEIRTVALREAAEVIKHGFGYNLRREDGVAAILGRIDK